MVSVVGGELLVLTMKEVVRWTGEKKCPLVWVLGVTIVSFLFLFRFAKRQKYSHAIVWEGKVYMRGKFFFAGHGKHSVTPYGGPPPT